MLTTASVNNKITAFGETIRSHFCGCFRIHLTRVETDWRYMVAIDMVLVVGRVVLLVHLIVGCDVTITYDNWESAQVVRVYETPD